MALGWDVKRAHLPAKLEANCKVSDQVGVDAPAREGTPVLKVVQENEQSNDETAVASGRSMQAEVAAYGQAFADERDEAGRRPSVRNG